MNIQTIAYVKMSDLVGDCQNILKLVRNNEDWCHRDEFSMALITCEDLWNFIAGDNAEEETPLSISLELAGVTKDEWERFSKRIWTLPFDMLVRFD